MIHFYILNHKGEILQKNIIIIFTFFLYYKHFLGNNTTKKVLRNYSKKYILK